MTASLRDGGWRLPGETCPEYQVQFGINILGPWAMLAFQWKTRGFLPRTALSVDLPQSVTVSAAVVSLLLSLGGGLIGSGTGVAATLERESQG